MWHNPESGEHREREAERRELLEEARDEQAERDRQNATCDVSRPAAWRETFEAMTTEELEPVIDIAMDVFEAKSQNRAYRRVLAEIAKAGGNHANH